MIPTALSPASILFKWNAEKDKEHGPTNTNEGTKQVPSTFRTDVIDFFKCHVINLGKI